MKKTVFLLFSLLLTICLCSLSLLGCTSFKEQPSSGTSSFDLSTSEQTCTISLNRYIHEDNRTTGNWSKVTSAKANGIDLLTNYAKVGENNRITYLTLDKGSTLTVTVTAEGYSSRSSLFMWEVVSGKHGTSSAIITNASGSDSTNINLNTEKGYFATKKGEVAEITLSYVVNENMYLLLWAGRVVDFRLK